MGPMRVKDAKVGDIIEMLNDVPLLGLSPSGIIFRVTHTGDRMMGMRKYADLEEELPPLAICRMLRANQRLW